LDWNYPLYETGTLLFCLLPTNGRYATGTLAFKIFGWKIRLELPALRDGEPCYSVRSPPMVAMRPEPMRSRFLVGKFDWYYSPYETGTLLFCLLPTNGRYATGIQVFKIFIWMRTN